MDHAIRSLLRDKRGASSLEYSVLAALIVLGVVGAIATSNTNGAIADVFSAYNASLAATTSR